MPNELPWRDQPYFHDRALAGGPMGMHAKERHEYPAPMRDSGTFLVVQFTATDPVCGHVASWEACRRVTREGDSRITYSIYCPACLNSASDDSGPAGDATSRPGVLCAT